jgi:RNA polymerase sigma factor (sigma-70 family)
MKNDGRSGYSFMAKYPNPAPDEEARIAEYEKLIAFICTPISLPSRQNRIALALVERIGIDATKQTMRIGVIHAARAYDPNHTSGASFKTFAIALMIGYMLQELRRNFRHEWNAHNNDRPVFFFEYDDGRGIMSLEHRSVEPMEAMEAYATVKMLERTNRASERELFVLECRALGLTLQEVGDELGVCRERARQIEKQAQERLTVHHTIGDTA